MARKKKTATKKLPLDTAFLLEARIKELAWNEFLSSAAMSAEQDDYDDHFIKYGAMLDKVEKLLGFDPEGGNERNGNAVSKVINQLFKLDVAEEQTVTLKITRMDRAKILANVDDYCTSEAMKESVREALGGK